jgi:hypothetical protein
MELLYFKEDSAQVDSQLVSSLIKESKSQSCTNSQAVYRISPLIIAKGSNNKDFVYPKVKLQDDDAISKGPFTHTFDDLHHHEIQNKFDARDNVFGKEPNFKEQTESNFLGVVDPEFDGETKEEIDAEVKTPEDEDDARKHLDKLNFLKGFRFVNDPFNSKSALTFEEDYRDAEVTVEGIDKRIENLFGIN